MTDDVLEKMNDAYFLTKETTEVGSMKAAASVLLREMMEPNHDMTATAVKPTEDRTEAVRIWKAVLTEFAKANNINIEDKTGSTSTAPMPDRDDPVDSILDEMERAGAKKQLRGTP